MNNDFHCACGRFLGYHHKYSQCFWCRHPKLSNPPLQYPSLNLLAAFIDYPESWDMAVYPSIESALLEIIFTSARICALPVNAPPVEDVQTHASECRKLAIPPEEGD